MKLILACLMACASTVAQAQLTMLTCNTMASINPPSLVADGDGPRIAAAEKKLIDLGADPHVIMDDGYTGTPEQYVEATRKACPEWQAASGGVKNNLIAFVVFPKRHKMGLFFGKEYEGVLQSDVIRSKYMGPSFKDADWTLGMTKGMDQAAIQIKAHQELALHPSTTTVTQQATDFSGLWWFLFAVLGAGIIVLVWWVIIGYQKGKIAKRDAQQRAVQARNDAASWVNDHPSSSGAEEFSRLSNSETYNPDTKGLTVAQYNEIAARYKLIRQTFVQPISSAPKKTKSNHHSYANSSSESNASSPPPSAGNQTIVEHHTTVIRDSHVDPFPVVVPVPIVVEEPYYPPPHYSAPEPSRSSDSWGSGSSSSSYDSDSSSSSWSDSSSSSDFGGGGSDFGGGSSDF